MAGPGGECAFATRPLRHRARGLPQNHPHGCSTAGPSRGTMIRPKQQRTRERHAMALMGFLKKQFIDVIEWTENTDGVLAWRYPMADHEIQNGGKPTVRESQGGLFSK